MFRLIAQFVCVLVLKVRSLGLALHRQHATMFHIRPSTSSVSHHLHTATPVAAAAARRKSPSAAAAVAALAAASTVDGQSSSSQRKYTTPATSVGVSASAISSGFD